MSSPSRILQIQGFVMLRDPCLFLRKSHVVSENFGGINMDLASQAAEYAIDMDVGTVQSPAVNVTMPGQKAGTPVPAAESKPLAPMQVPIGANGCCGNYAPPRHL